MRTTSTCSCRAACSWRAPRRWGASNSLVNDNLGLFETAGSEVGNPIPGLSTFEFPAFREPDRDPAVFLRNLNFLDATLGSRAVTPDHYLHVAAIGGGRPCPATEPQETGVITPWPTEVVAPRQVPESG